METQDRQWGMIGFAKAAMSYVIDVVAIIAFAILGQCLWLLVEPFLLPQLSVPARIVVLCWAFPLPTGLLYFRVRGRKGWAWLLHAVGFGLGISLGLLLFIYWAFGQMP